MNKVKLNATREEIARLRKLFPEFYDEDNKAKNIYKAPDKDFPTVQKYVDYLYEIGMPKGTSVKNMGIILEQNYENYSQFPEYSEGTTTMTGAPEGLSSTTSTEEARGREAIKKTEEQARIKQEIRTGQKAAVEAGIKKQQEIYAKVKIEEAPKGTEEVLEQIKNTPTEKAIEDTKKLIQERVPEITEKTAEDTAAVIVINVQMNWAPSIQDKTVEKVAKTPEKTDLAAILSDQSKSLSELQDLRNLTQNVTKLAFGEEFQKAVLPDVKVDEVSDSPGPGFVPVTMPFIYKEPAQAATKMETVSFGQTWVQVQLAQMGAGGIQGTNYNPKAFQFSFSQFRPITGAARNSSLNQVAGLAGDVAKQAVTKVATKAITSKVTVAIGTAGGPLGTAVGFAVGEVLNKIASSKIFQKVKGYSAYIIGGAAGLIAFGFFGLTAGIGAFVAGTTISAGAFGAGTGGLTLAGVGGSIGAVGGTIASALVASIATPVIVTLVSFPVVVALILFIINSGAYVVPPGTSMGTVPILCNTSPPGRQAAGSEAANAAICIYTYLNQFHLNPLFKGMVGGSTWKQLEKYLSSSAISALALSAPVDGHLQCVGFTSATAGQAYGQSFGQINACGYIQNPPSGYRFISGTKGIRTGDFFVIGSKNCSNSSPGHIGVVVSVDGVMISCADANYVGPGKVRVAHGCFPLSAIAGYLRK